MLESTSEFKVKNAARKEVANLKCTLSAIQPDNAVLRACWDKTWKWATDQNHRETVESIGSCPFLYDLWSCPAEK